MRLTELQRAERDLAKAYCWRQRRYRVNSWGTKTGAGNCFSDDNMAKEITALENRVEELGGDVRVCLSRGRAMADAKERG